jgi:hypothetical protein
MKTQSIIRSVGAVCLTLLNIAVNAQEKKEPEYPSLSLYAGYGTHGVNFRVDLQVADRFFNNSSTLLYLELGGQRITFDQPNIEFAHVVYTSDSRIITLGGGIAQEFMFNRVSLMPFVGLRNEYVRFVSTELVEAIGDHGLIRYSDNTYTRQVGPEIDNAYGDAVSFDLGFRLGIRLTGRLQLSGTFGYSPISFNSSDTLFGQYWGEAPYPNPYWVKRKPTRGEFALRFTF